ncbi:MAG: response regulator, partial [Proteobacteria bacterium]|nr:response regulator [Pseudomonadota bacterium]
AMKKEYLAKNTIRLLIVDDSLLVRSIIRRAVEDDPEIEIIGEAADPFEAREKIMDTDPDVITLDIIMPRMDGISFLKKLMVYKPLPVIIVSTIAQKGGKQRLRADKIGAFAIIDKEDLKLYQGGNQAKLILTEKIKLAARTPIKKKTVEEIKDI